MTYGPAPVTGNGIGRLSRATGPLVLVSLVPLGVFLDFDAYEITNNDGTRSNWTRWHSLALAAFCYLVGIGLAQVACTLIRLFGRMRDPFTWAMSALRKALMVLLAAQAAPASDSASTQAAT